MTGNEEKNSCKKNDFTNGIPNNILIKSIDNFSNVTELDMSNGKIQNLDGNIKFPASLLHLNLSNNKLTEVPSNVLKLDNLKSLDISFNSILVFDDIPSFCHSIEKLNLSKNSLNGPPLWVWTEKPRNLKYLNISNNKDLCSTFTDNYLNELCQYKTLVNDIDMHNCRISKYVKLLASFCHTRVITLGNEEYVHHLVNNLDHFPCEGLEECRDVEVLNLANTQLFHINSNIDIYTNLKELNLSQNNLNSLPNEFYKLVKLETCILSYNSLDYLPSNICELTSLVTLRLDNNKLCMLPENLHEIPNLKVLDLYNNKLHEGPSNLNLEEVDLAQNCFDEPDDEEYLLKKQKLRISYPDRKIGRKVEVTEQIEPSLSSSDEEELYELATNEIIHDDQKDNRTSSPEDWDSDDYWIPQYDPPATPPLSPWIYYVQTKMREGNFCPMDAHPISISDLVRL
ncbi:adenylate cyclase-like isoform X2 [Spodoptera litura]|uniref:Adenylate cyclase-like isoform X2 n=1 Tax=Spodoptera litura TaxID=69820 RepID=A0A9J7EIJ1_SPOLT|nr:adenylate cyclase-like isoform X2 [Spodoptera litura]